MDERQVVCLDLQCEFTDHFTKTTCLAIAFQHELTVHVYIQSWSLLASKPQLRNQPRIS